MATDLCDGEIVTLGASKLIPAIHASCAVPGMFRPVRLYGRYLVDGGVLEPVPVQTARDNGAEIVIAVDISENLSDQLPKNIFGVMVRSFEICYLKLTHYATQSADVVIRPQLKKIGMFNDKTNQLVYNAGKDAAKNALPYIRQLIRERETQLYNPQDDL